MQKTKLFSALFFFIFIVIFILPAFADPTAEEILKEIRFRSIGPASMSGRIADIDVDPKNLWTVYVATASGGVWKTTNNGITWRPIFDDGGSGSIGDVTVSLADNNIVWVGTGENSNRNSVGWGDGVYKSTDGGKTWTNMGLKETEQIARIITHPKDPNIVWVAAIGPLWSASEHRGVFMTEDGGKTWTKVLYVDENTGASDLIIDPKNPKVLYAGMYERRRFPWTFYSGGKNGGVFKSTDGGKTWKKLTNGLPKGMTGKIGLTIFPKNPKIVYAVIEAERGGKPEEDQNGFYRTDDAGKTWKRLGLHSTRPFYYHEILVDPEDDKRIYSCSTNLMLSTDGGMTWNAVRAGVHPDWHAIWINPSDPRHIWAGNDGGVFVTYDKGETWKHMSQIVAAQFYAITVDMAVPYHVYGGLQDNGSWGGPSVSREREGIGNYHWFNVGGGDGFYVQVDWLDNETIYSESQNGGISRRNRRTGETRSIRPRAPEGEQYRFNWNSPIHLSPHNPRIVWFGGNKLFKSIDRGDNWRVASPDLTTNDPEKLKPMGGLTQERTGAETHCTIVTIAESRLKPGVVWVGTDDGLVHVTQNDGYEWTKVSDSIPDVPPNSWCSRVEPSRFKLERCYVTFDNHRRGDFKPYVFVTEDFGKTWKNISSNLPENGSVYVVREDPVNEDLLYVGTEFALFVSFDRGGSWTRWKSGLPTVAIHDIVIHPREREIVMGTHGRGIFIAPVEGLQMLTKENSSKNFVLFEPVTTRRWVPWSGAGYGDGRDGYYGENPPSGARIFYYLKDDVKDLKVEVLSITGEVIGTIPTPPTTKGLHVVHWNMVTGGEGRRRTLAEPGEYAVRLTIGSESQTQRLVVEPDPVTQEKR
ncbi:MAG TPA: hypothetical protein VNK96_07875 [Fimbriimonadales bacterium]|nr:hypothetical protein [Fimbriimonadales bacterium]